MRYVEVMVPDDRIAELREVLDEEGIEYAATADVSGREYDVVVSFPLPSQAVEPVFDRLDETGISDDASAVVIDVETFVSRDHGRLETRFGELEGGGRISRQELQARAAELTPTAPVYTAMTLISAVVATAGLLLDSPAVIVGSMVIAPLIGPALTASVGAVIGEADLRTTGLIYQFGGVAVAIVGSILFAGLVRLAGIEPAGIDIVAVAELEERVAPNLLALVVALGAGVAGVVSLTRELSVAIVGVMIAAALIPPAAAAGIALAWGLYGAALGATVLVLVNTLSINLAALLTLWGGGYRPAGLFDVPVARKQTTTLVVAFALVMVVLLVPLAGATLVDLEATQLESDVEGSAEGVLAEPAYDGLAVDSIDVVLDDDYPVRSIDHVAITVVGSVNPTPATKLAERLADAAADHVDEPLSVEVQFVATEEAVAVPAGEADGETATAGEADGETATVGEPDGDPPAAQASDPAAATPIPTREVVGDRPTAGWSGTGDRASVRYRGSPSP